ncbi:MAG: proton-conducting transporter transmembrane domain-containing protein [Thermoguttaceae bacterium]
MLGLLVAVPAIAALISFALPWNGLRRALLVSASAAHTGLTVASLRQTPAPMLDGWIAVDAASLLFLVITSAVFLVTSVYAVGYLAQEKHPAVADPAAVISIANYPEAVFTGCLLLFFAAMTLVLVSHHWGLMWVAVEATTLASAPLIYFHRHPRSLEATWKYLMICSVGIALALLGNFFLAASAKTCPGEPFHLTVLGLESHASGLDPRWLRAAFLLLLVGYGTKMGLAPMHTWLPDAHSEAPSMVSALLSGVLLNCAFLAVLRGHSLLVKAGEGAFSRDLLVLFGLMSMAFAAVFVIRQGDYKRLLAYSSVEHMGILVLGVGVGGIGGFGSLLHAVNHSLTKAMLFLTAGNTLHHFRTKSTRDVRGLLRVLPITGGLWVVGMLAITGSPPFGTFLSELVILKSMIDGDRIFVAVFYLAALATVLVSMSAIVIAMVYGEPAGESGAAATGGSPNELASAPGSPRGEPAWSVLPPTLLGLAVLLLGLYVPAELSDLLHDAAKALGAE